MIEHDPVGDRQKILQHRFLLYASLFAPSLMPSLREECYSTFREYTCLYTEGTEVHRTPPKGMHVEVVKPNERVIVALSWISMTCDEVGQRVRQKVLDWSTTRNLNANWCRDHVLEVMLHWPEEKDTERLDAELCFGFDRLAAVAPHYIGPLPHENPVRAINPPPGMPPYHFPESRERYLSVIEQQALAAIEGNELLGNAEASHRQGFVKAILQRADDYISAVAKQYELEQGVKVVPERSDLNRDLMWTVQFQILKRSYTEIARAENMNSSTVSRAVRKFLKEINLPERPSSRQGRPAGSKDSPTSRRQLEKHNPRPQPSRRDLDRE